MLSLSVDNVLVEDDAATAAGDVPPFVVPFAVSKPSKNHLQKVVGN